MIKKTITFVDYNGTTRTEDHHFNLNKDEIAELQFSIEGGLNHLIENIVKAEDAAQLIKLFKKLILLSYGEKSEDGRYFRKNEELTERFASSPAYSELFMELATDDAKAAAFINGVLPSDMTKAIASPDR